MNKKLFTLIALLAALCFFNSCLSDNDEDIDEEWKAYNDQIFNNTAANSEYRERISLTGNGNVYWKYSDEITSTMTTTASASVKITEDGTPYITDSVVCRYTAWYLDYDGEKVVFDTTEKNEQAGRRFTVGGVVSGWTDMLMYMKEGDEVEVCIPYQLGYGTSGTTSIPGYTTLWFNIKLLKIIADNPNEFD